MSLYDRMEDRRLGIRTCGRDYSHLSSENYGYDPTPYAVLRRLAKAGWVGPDDTLVDYGCGMGRVGLYLHDRTGCRVVGLDLDPQRIREARLNLRAYERRTGAPADVRFVRADAEEFDPSGGTCFYFFNPFSPSVFQRVVAGIAAARQETGRDMRVLFFYTTREYLACFAGESHLRAAGVVDGRTLTRRDPELDRLLVFDVV